MRGINRIVNTSFWDDSKITEFFTPEDKYFMLYLLTNPHTTQLGIYELSISKASFELGYSKESVMGLIDRFDSKYHIIKYSKETNEILIKNFLRHSIVKGGKPVMDCLKKEESKVKDKSLLSYLYKYLNNHVDDINETVKEYINTLEKYKDIDNDNNNDNDNDNERIVYNESSITNRQLIEKYENLKARIIVESISLPSQGTEKCEWCGNTFDNLEKHHYPIPKRLNGKKIVNICHTCHKKFHDIEYSEKIGVYSNETSKSKKDKPVKHKYGQYENVLLSDEDYNKLMNEFPLDYKERIENLSAGIKIHGYTYKDHLAVIRQWAKKDKKQQSNNDRITNRVSEVDNWV